MTSAIFADAAEKWAAMRLDFSVALEAHYFAAEAATNGYLLNPLGKARGVDPYSLVSGPESRAHKYASEELLAYWENHPRPSLERFEVDWLSIQRGW